MMANYRSVLRTLGGRNTSDGAGVKLNRAFSYYDEPLIDPFLMMDNFNSVDPESYMAGFPWHPHRGIETVTYMLKGSINHEDSIGNAGTINPGGIQWMTAGSGIIHQEMPELNKEGINGFQIWVNLPAAEKMTMPRYRDMNGIDIPELFIEDSKLRVITGSINNNINSSFSFKAETSILDVSVPPEQEILIPVRKGYTALIYVYRGAANIGITHHTVLENSTAVLDRDGENILISSGTDPLQFILLTGKPLNESVAWKGPIVMNSWEEIQRAYRDLNDGTFIKNREPKTDQIS